MLNLRKKDTDSVEAAVTNRFDFPETTRLTNSTLTVYDPIYFIGATELGTFLLSSKLNNT